MFISKETGDKSTHWGWGRIYERHFPVQFLAFRKGFTLGEMQRSGPWGEVGRELLLNACCSHSDQELKGFWVRCSAAVSAHVPGAGLAVEQQGWRAEGLLWDPLR